MKNAFTLVELSIVLVILGLLVGGVLAGQNLIRAAELRKVITDTNEIKTAIFAFKEKYFATPGDMTNASAFWPTAHDGNGDGKLEHNSDAINFWHHLAQAGMHNNTIAPVTSTVSQTLIDTHSPRCPLGNCGYAFVHFFAWTIHPHLVGRDNFVVGSQGSSYPSGGFIPAEEAWNLDTKVDDGQPDTGEFLSANCISGSYPASTYNLSNGTASCLLIMDFMQ